MSIYIRLHMAYPPVLFISVFNFGGITLALNHLESIKRQGITNYRAYVSDQESYDVLIEKGHPVERIPVSDMVLPKEKTDFGTTDFNTLSYARYKVIGELLRQNQPIWYLDIDTVVLKNLNDAYNDLNHTKYDVAIQNDIDMLCTGCMLLFPTPNAIKLCDVVYSNRTSRDNDQIILAHILRNKTQRYSIFTLNMLRFPNGLLYFKELDKNPRYRELQEQFKQSTQPVYFVHANWIVGCENKINAFKQKGLWYIL